MNKIIRNPLVIGALSALALPASAAITLGDTLLIDFTK
jgi:hypothetical protein